MQFSTVIDGEGSSWKAQKMTANKRTLACTFSASTERYSF